MVIWLNEGDRDFHGGNFFFDAEENAIRCGWTVGPCAEKQLLCHRPQAGHAAIFGADVPHGLTAVSGLKFSRLT